MGLTVAVAFTLAAPAASPAAAVPNPCPEPKQRFGRACVIGPANLVTSYIDTADDVDTDGLDVPPGATGAEPADYAAPPARNYALQAANLGAGYHEVGRQERNDGRSASVVFIADDASLTGDPLGESQVTPSPSRVAYISSDIYIAPYGNNEELTAAIDEQRQELSKVCQVEEAQGWGSEQVWSCSTYLQPFYVRAIMLKHRNAVATITTLGLEQYTTWAHISSLMSTVEQRIHGAIAGTAPPAAPEPACARYLLTPNDITARFVVVWSGLSSRVDWSLCSQGLVRTSKQDPIVQPDGVVYLASVVFVGTNVDEAQRVFDDTATELFKSSRYQEVPIPQIGDRLRGALAWAAGPFKTGSQVILFRRGRVFGMVVSSSYTVPDSMDDALVYARSMAAKAGG